MMPCAPLPSSAHPPFDDAAKARAKQLAAAVGKPGTKEPGLLAIHAVLHRKRFRFDEQAYSFYGAKKPRFYEWKPLISCDEAGSASSVASNRIQQMLNHQPEVDVQIKAALYEAWQVELRTIQYFEEQVRCRLLPSSPAALHCISSSHQPYARRW
jgi:hypothetical protein